MGYASPTLVQNFCNPDKGLAEQLTTFEHCLMRRSEFGQKQTLAQQSIDLKGGNLLLIKTIALILIIFLGIPNQIIDYKHRKRKAYEHGNAWAYYAQLSREGKWEGKFMMWSTYVAIAFVVFVIGHMFYALSN